MGMETRVWNFKVHYHGKVVGFRNLINILGHWSVVKEPLSVNVDVNGKNDVIGSDRNSIAPGASFTQIDGHLGEIIIINRKTGCHTRNDFSCGVIDCPQRFKKELLDPTVLVSPTSPKIEVIGHSNPTG